MNTSGDPGYQIGTAPEAAVDGGDSTSPGDAERDTDTMVAQLPTMVAGDIQKALRKNETRLWHMHGMRGYVVLSDDSAAATDCKNVAVTLITGQDQRQSAPQKWCRSQEGEWSPS